MSVEVDMTGLDAQLRKVAYRTKSGGVKATLAGAMIVKEALKVNTPYENESDRKWKAQRQIEAKTGESHEFKHMRDDIVISKPDKLGEVTVGYGKDTAWRSHFVNDGTIHQPPQHFAEKTVAETREMVTATMQRVINTEVAGL